MNPGSEPPSRTSTPRSFTAQAATTEDLLKSQTVGLVNLADFRKRRADVLEQKEKEAQDRTYGKFKPSASGPATPSASESDGALTPQNEPYGEPFRKKKKKRTHGLLSFGTEEMNGDDDLLTTKKSPQEPSGHQAQGHAPKVDPEPPGRRLTPNPTASIPPPKAITKASLQADTAARDALRKEFLALQEEVKNTEVLIPFVFYDGTNVPGGTVKLKKGDHIWLFLDKCRKIGAEMGVSGAGAGSNLSGTKSRDDTRRAWARVGVDDLMCVRGGLIIPHHYELYYFIANRIPNPSKQGELLFDYSNSAPSRATAVELLLRTPSSEVLEGKDHDPAMTKVVDRRWYERNKHIYPASLWQEFEPGKDFVKLANARKDAQGNAFFF